MTILPIKAVEVFYSYAHEDEHLRRELEKHLSNLRQQGFITEWHDRRIVAGIDWAQAIDTHLNTASVILLLISPDFLASDYCYSVELRRAMERHTNKEAIVIPIILRPVDWKGASFEYLQSLPINAKPITTWSNRDMAFLDVAKGIRNAIETLNQSSSSKKEMQTVQGSRLLDASLDVVLDKISNFVVIEGDLKIIYTVAGESEGTSVYGRGQQLRIALLNAQPEVLDIISVNLRLLSRERSYDPTLKYNKLQLSVPHTRLPIENITKPIQWNDKDELGALKEIGNGRIRLGPKGKKDDIHQIMFTVEAKASGMWTYVIEVEYVEPQTGQQRLVTCKDKCKLLLRGI